MQPTYEQVVAGGGTSFVCDRREPADGWGFTWHVHPEVELTLIERGAGRRFVGDHVGEFGPGDLVLVGPGLPHTWQSAPPAAGSAVVVQFRPALIAADRPELAGARRVLARAAGGLRFADAGAVSDRVAVMPGLGPLRRWTALLEVLDTLDGLGGEPLSSPGFLPRTTAGDRRRVDQVMALIDRRLDAPDHRPPSQAEAARLVGLTPSAFTRFFRRAAGRPYLAHVNLLRVGRSCRLLTTTDLPVTQIAHRSGFANLANFNRTFKRLRRTTPTAYRRLMRG